MRWPRLRFSVRALMVSVAIAGVVLGLSLEVTGLVRARWFRTRAAYHAGRVVYYRDQEVGILKHREPKRPGGQSFAYQVFTAQAAYDRAVADYHERLRIKYERAARSPMRPVEPDPPPFRKAPRDFMPNVARLLGSP